MSKAKRINIEVQGTSIGILSQPSGDFISLTDMVRNFDGAGALIEQWLKNKELFSFSESGNASTIRVLIPSNSRELKMRQVETVVCIAPLGRSYAPTAQLHTSEGQRPGLYPSQEEVEA